MGQIRRDLPNDEYQAAVGSNNASASNVFATIADLASAGIPTGIGVGTDAYASTIPGVTSYNDGDTYIIKFTNGNTADSTIDINGLGVKTLTKQVGVQVTGGDILAGQEIIIIYDGTNFQCIGLSTNQLFAFVTNAEAITITKGQPVYAFGGTGNRMSVKLASNTSDATSAQTVGLVYSSSIAANQTGFIIIQGVISGVNTGAYTAGNQLYLGATAGTLTNVKPYAPNHLVYIGIVERANAGNGLIYVRTQNGYELDELHDVDLITTPPTDGDVLTYDGVSGLWVNQSPSLSSSGRFGITDSNGVYTYYTTLSLAMTAATAGQTIEMFTDYTESGAVTITLKNGVNINGNGHTYTYTNATGNCFIDNGVAVTCVISNLTVVRTNYTSGSIYVQTSTNSDTDWLGSKLYMTANSGYGVQLVGTIRNCWTKITGNGTAIYSAYSSNAKLYSSHGESTGAGTGLDCRTSIVYNSTGISNSGFGGYLDQSKTYNSVFQSTSNYGVQYGGELFSSTIISVSSTALFIGSCYNCTIISTSGSCVACQNNSYYNCTMITSSGNCTNFQSYNHNCVFRTDSNTVTQAYFTPEFYNCSIQTNWNNASGHALVQPGNVVNCYISVANTSANCLYNASPLNVKYANNSFKGATTPVNANVTQAIVNTQDNQGNILL